MSTRKADTIGILAAIAAITMIVCVSVLCGYNHALVKIAIAAIAALAGFSANNLIKRQ